MATSPKRRKKEPVELLIIVCNPDREGARLEEASAEADAVLKKCRDKRVERLESCTVEQLRDQLVELRPRMLLFIGHGDAKHESSGQMGGSGTEFARIDKVYPSRSRSRWSAVTISIYV